MAPALAAMESLAPPCGRADRIPAYTPAIGPSGAASGCCSAASNATFFPGVNAATVRVLAAEGFDVSCARAAGLLRRAIDAQRPRVEAADFARALIDSLEDAEVDHVVVNAAGCGSTMKEYAAVLAEDPDYAERAARFPAQVRDVSELLDAMGTRRGPPSAAGDRRLPRRVSSGACPGIRAQPRALLSAIPGLELREIAESELCCGSAGI